MVDSDDWVEETALEKILDVLKGWYQQGSLTDMLISNYVYEKVGVKNKKVIHYRNVLPQDRIMTVGGYRKISSVAVYFDAFCDLPDRIIA